MRIFLPLTISLVFAGCARIPTGIDHNLLDADILAKGVDTSASSSSDQQMNAGRDVINISPVVAIKGAGAIALATGTICMIVFAIIYSRARKAMRAMAWAIEYMPPEAAEVAKAGVSKQAYKEGISDYVYRRVQRDINRLIKSKK